MGIHKIDTVLENWEIGHSKWAMVHLIDKLFTVDWNSNTDRVLPRVGQMKLQLTRIKTRMWTVDKSHVAAYSFEFDADGCLA